MGGEQPFHCQQFTVANSISLGSEIEGAEFQWNQTIFGLSSPKLPSTQSIYHANPSDHSLLPVPFLPPFVPSPLEMAFGNDGLDGMQGTSRAGGAGEAISARSPSTDTRPLLSMLILLSDALLTYHPSVRRVILEVDDEDQATLDALSVSLRDDIAPVAQHRFTRVTSFGNVPRGVESGGVARPRLVALPHSKLSHLS